MKSLFETYVIKQGYEKVLKKLNRDEKERYASRYPKDRGVLPFCAGSRSDGKGLEALEERKHWTAREIMQAYGQFFRTINYDFWVDYLFNVIEEKEYKNVYTTNGRRKQPGKFRIIL